jgi:hypothetical protein
MAFLTTNPSPFIINVPELQNVQTSATGASGFTSLSNTINDILTYLNTANSQININTIGSQTSGAITFTSNINLSNSVITFLGSNLLGSNVLNGPANYIAFQVNGIEQARLTTTGLGIGVTNPAVKLDVNGTTRINGSLGIGTATPNYSLDVVGSGRFSDTVYAPFVRGSTISASTIYSQNVYANAFIGAVSYGQNVVASTFTGEMAYISTFSGETVYASTVNCGLVYASSVNCGLVYASTFSGETVYASTVNCGLVYASTFSGETVYASTVNSGLVYASTFSGETVYASSVNCGLVFGSTFGGETVYASTFNGQSGLLSSIGVGILAPELPLDVQGGGIIRGPLYVSSFGALSSQTGNVIVSGDVFANGFFYPSDPLLKRDIRPYISHGLPEPVEFIWRSNGNRDIGVLANEIASLEPACVTRSVTGQLNVDYPKLTVLLLAEVRDLKAQMSTLMARLP